MIALAHLQIASDGGVVSTDTADLLPDVNAVCLHE